MWRMIKAACTAAALVFPQIYSYSMLFTMSTAHWIASLIARHFIKYLLVQQKPLAPLYGGRVGRSGSHEVAGIGYAKWDPLVPFSLSTCHKEQLNSWSNSLAVRVMNHSRLSACQGKMEPFEDHPSNRGRQTGFKKGLSESRLFNFQQY